MTQILWAKAEEEGLTVEVNRQDADSSSLEGFRYSYSNVVGMCEGPMVKNSRSLKQKANLPKHLLPQKRSTFMLNHAAFIANKANE